MRVLGAVIVLALLEHTGAVGVGLVGPALLGWCGLIDYLTATRGGD